MSNVGYLCSLNYNKEMTDTINIAKFKAHFSKKLSFTINDIRSYYHSHEPELKDSTLRWRVSDLKNKGVVTAIGQGIYSLQSKPLWHPRISSPVTAVYKKLLKQYNKLNFTIWSTAWLNDFTNLQAFHYLVIIQVEKDYAEAAFEFLKEKGFQNLYYKPDKKEVNYYFGEANETYVVTTLISKSPLQTVEKIKIPRLEKILVDLFCDKNILNGFQGSELKNIYSKAFNNYAINTTVLINYARRRAREKELSEYVKNNLSINLSRS